MIPRPIYFVYVNGLAASRPLSGAAAQRAADKAMAARPDASVEIVQVDSDTGRRIGSFVLQRSSFP
jgi:hypothetical protein